MWSNELGPPRKTGPNRMKKFRMDWFERRRAFLDEEVEVYGAADQVHPAASGGEASSEKTCSARCLIRWIESILRALIAALLRAGFTRQTT